jgi:hypothetical protein
MKKTLVLTAGLALGIFGATAAQARQVCHDVQVKHIQSQDTHRVIGTGVGAVAGGLLGHQIGGGKGKTLATVGGADHPMRIKRPTTRPSVAVKRSRINCPRHQACVLQGLGVDRAGAFCCARTARDLIWRAFLALPSQRPGVPVKFVQKAIE